MNILKLLWSIANPGDSGSPGENMVERVMKLLGTVAVVLGAVLGGINAVISSLGGG